MNKGSAKYGPNSIAAGAEKNLSRIKAAGNTYIVKGGLGIPVKPNHFSNASQTNAPSFKDRKEQEAHFGLKRGKNASYKGD